VGRRAEKETKRREERSQEEKGTEKVEPLTPSLSITLNQKKRTREGDMGLKTISSGRERRDGVHLITNGRKLR